MAKKNGKRNKTLFVIIGIVVILGVVGVLGMQRGNQNVSLGYEVVEVTRQDMQTTVRGSGVVEAQNKLEVYAPANLVIDEVYVESGDEITFGMPILKIDKDAYLDAESAIQSSINQVNQNIDMLYNTDGDRSMYSKVDGIVKEIYVEQNDSIEAAMNMYDSLMVISADRNMKLEVEVEDAALYTEGSTMTVKVDDEEVEAIITEINAFESTIKLIFKDDKYTVGQEVEVFDEDGVKVGSAKMQINVPIYVEGTAGKVSYVYVAQNDIVSSGSRLIGIKENEASADLISLTEQKEDLQMQLDELKQGLADIGIGSDYTLYAIGEGILDEFALTPYMTIAEGMKLFTVQSTQPLMMDVPIDELDIAQVKVGQQAEIKFEALPGDVYEGVITKINSLGQSINGVTNYMIQVEIVETGDILIGMSGNAKILTEEKKDVISVPVEAVQLIDDEYYVILGADANVKTVADHKIETGLNDGAYIEIIDGLSDGDTIAVPVDTGLDIQFGPGSR